MWQILGYLDNCMKLGGEKILAMSLSSLSLQGWKEKSAKAISLYHILFLQWGRRKNTHLISPPQLTRLVGARAHGVLAEVKFDKGPKDCF